MATVLYNTDINEIVSILLPNGYSGSLPANIIELTVVDNPPPVIDESLEYWERVLIRDGDDAIWNYTVFQMTAEQLAEKDALSYPNPISNRRLRLGLNLEGYTASAIDAWIEDIPEVWVNINVSNVVPIFETGQPTRWFIAGVVSSSEYAGVDLEVGYLFIDSEGEVYEVHSITNSNDATFEMRVQAVSSGYVPDPETGNGTIEEGIRQEARELWNGQENYIDEDWLVDLATEEELDLKEIFRNVYEL